MIHKPSADGIEATGAGAPPDEIEITEPMIEAGVKALALCESGDSWWSTAEEVYRAMEAVRLSQLRVASLLRQGRPGFPSHATLPIECNKGT